MKILIVSQYFWPEIFRINDLALELKKRGHSVTVLTGKPNYPGGQYYKGFGFLSHPYDDVDGISVYRVPILARGSANAIKLALNYSSFVVSSCLFILFHKGKYDVTFTFGLSPITQAYPAILYKRLHKTRTFLWIQDLWPESVSAVGKINSGWVLSLLNSMVRNIYRNVDKVLVSSEAFSESIKEKGIPFDKIAYMPNWAEEIFSQNSTADIEKYRNIIPNGFIVMFAGNIGEAQDFESVVKAATLTKNIEEIKWVIIGDGSKRKWLESEVENLGLQNTFVLLGQYPLEEMPSFFVHADVTLVALKDEYIFSLTIPSKTQSYMAFGKPILSMLNGIGSKIIMEAQCGYVAKAGDFTNLAENVITAFQLSEDDLLKLGINSKMYYNLNFEKRNIIDRLIRMFEDS